MRHFQNLAQLEKAYLPNGTRAEVTYGAATISGTVAASGNGLALASGNRFIFDMSALNAVSTKNVWPVARGLQIANGEVIFHGGSLFRYEGPTANITGATPSGENLQVITSAGNHTAFIIKGMANALSSDSILTGQDDQLVNKGSLKALVSQVISDGYVSKVIAEQTSNRYIKTPISTGDLVTFTISGVKGGVPFIAEVGYNGSSSEAIVTNDAVDIRQLTSSSNKIGYRIDGLDSNTPVVVSKVSTTETVDIDWIEGWSVEASLPGYTFTSMNVYSSFNSKENPIRSYSDLDDSDTAKSTDLMSAAAGRSLKQALQSNGYQGDVSSRLNIDALILGGTTGTWNARFGISCAAKSNGNWNTPPTRVDLGGAMVYQFGVDRNVYQQVFFYTGVIWTRVRNGDVVSGWKETSDDTHTHPAANNSRAGLMSATHFIRVANIVANDSWIGSNTQMPWGRLNLNGGTATASSIGVVRLSDSTSSQSGVNGGYAATPAAVKKAYDLAASKLSSVPDSSTQQKGIVKLSDSVTSSATDLAATANAVRRAYSLAAGKWTAVDAATNRKGIVQLSDSDNSSSSTVAATSAAVKKVYDLARGKWTSQDATTSQKGIVQLNNAVNSSSTSEAATANAVRLAYNLANGLVSSKANAAHRHANASAAQDGFMSAADYSIVNKMSGGSLGTATGTVTINADASNYFAEMKRVLGAIPVLSSNGATVKINLTGTVTDFQPPAGDYGGIVHLVFDNVTTTNQAMIRDVTNLGMEGTLTLSTPMTLTYSNLSGYALNIYRSQVYLSEQLRVYMPNSQVKSVSVYGSTLDGKGKYLSLYNADWGLTADSSNIQALSCRSATKQASKEGNISLNGSYGTFIDVSGCSRIVNRYGHIVVDKVYTSTDINCRAGDITIRSLQDDGHFRLDVYEGGIIRAYYDDDDTSVVSNIAFNTITSNGVVWEHG